MSSRKKQSRPRSPDPDYWREGAFDENNPKASKLQKRSRSSSPPPYEPEIDDDGCMLASTQEGGLQEHLEPGSLGDIVEGAADPTEKKRRRRKPRPKRPEPAPIDSVNFNRHQAENPFSQAPFEWAHHSEDEMELNDSEVLLSPEQGPGEGGDAPLDEYTFNPPPGAATDSREDGFPAQDAGTPQEPAGGWAVTPPPEAAESSGVGAESSPTPESSVPEQDQSDEIPIGTPDISDNGDIPDYTDGDADAQDEDSEPDSLSTDVITRIDQLNKDFAQLQDLGNDVSEAQRALGSANTRYAFKGWSYVRKLSALRRELGLQSQAWSDAMGLMDQHNKKIQRYCYLGDNENEVRAMCRKNNHSADEVAFKKLLLYANICANPRADSGRSKCAEAATKIRNQFTMFLHKHSGDDGFLENMHLVYKHVKRKARVYGPLP